MVIDLDKCVGCQACTIACKAENNVPHGSPEEQKRAIESYWHKVITVSSGEYPAVNT
jgi:molybdopterin-containing oxidoreductase family iron-sulfur binding subunit